MPAPTPAPILAGVGATSASARKLYLPYSYLPTQAGPGRGKITFHWFCVGRQEAIGDYTSLLLDYRGLARDAQEKAERLVDEFFREEEFHLLRSYLESRHGVEVRTAMLTTPLASVKPDTATRLGTLRPFYIEPPEQQTEVLLHPLANEEGYTLPFTVWGAYLNPSRPGR